MRPHGVRHIVWDWNGTLLDDTWLCIEVVNGMLAARGLPVLSVARYQEVFDFPVVHYYRKIGFDFDVESFEKLGTEFIEGYERRKSECRLHPDARDVLDRLHRAGFTQSVLSNYPHRTLEEILRTHDVRGLFDDVVGADDHYARGKAEHGKRWLARSGRSGREGLMVGDTLHDFEVAREVGLHAALVTIGSHNRARLAPTGAPVYDSLTEFAEAVLGGRG